VGSKWAKTLRIATLALVHSTVEYFAPVWCRSKHTRLLDKPIHDALLLVTGCLRPIPIENLFVLPGITPTEHSRKRATLSLDRRAMDPEHLFHDRLLFTPTKQQQELKSRHSIVPAAPNLLKDLDKSNATAAFWADHKLNMEFKKNTSRLHTFIPSPDRPSWVRLNRLLTSVGLFR